jgi:acyl-CoA reductase-like NAD-dependent aldehyde dehydrogenase
LIEYQSFENALRLCNSSEYGLTAGIYTGNEEEVEKFTDSIEVQKFMVPGLVAMKDTVWIYPL